MNPIYTGHPLLRKYNNMKGQERFFYTYVLCYPIRKKSGIPENFWKNKNVLVAGPKASEFPNILESIGANVFVVDKDPKRVYTNCYVGDIFNYKDKHDIIIASNSLQHNYNYDGLSVHIESLLNPNGLLFLCEKSSNLKTSWIENRVDPLWIRNCDDMVSLWGSLLNLIDIRWFTFSGTFPEIQDIYRVSKSYAKKIMFVGKKYDITEQK